MVQLRREELAKSHSAKSHSVKSHSAKSHSVKSRTAEPGVSPVLFVCVGACVFVYTKPDLSRGRRPRVPSSTVQREKRIRKEKRDEKKRKEKER